jgi:precorrin-6B methylase 1
VHDIHVVASGDPLLHGIGNTLIKMFGPDRVAVLPHVSSVTLACARVGWAVQDTEIISLVTAQALAGESIVHPSGGTLAAGGAIALLTLGAAAAAIVVQRTPRSLMAAD